MSVKEGEKMKQKLHKMNEGEKEQGITPLSIISDR